MQFRTENRGQRQRWGTLTAGALIALLTAAPLAAAGQINLGDPSVDGNTVSVPILLQADASGDVSTLDFRVRYDPSQLRPVRANPGPSAQNADKDVIGNERNPGEYSVVMMGLNRNVVGDGEVANITFERVGGGSAADVRITQTTLASPDAVEIPSRGSSRTISFTGGESAPAQQESPQQPGDTAQQDPQGSTPGQTQTAQNDQQSGLGEGVVGGPAAPVGDGATPRQQQQQLAQGATPVPGGDAEAQPGTQGGIAGSPGDSREVQGRLQDAIASADAARSGVGTPTGTPNGTQGEQQAGAAPGQPAQGAVSPESGAQGGQTVDARVQIAQAPRSATDSNQAAQQRDSAAPGTAGAAETPQATAPMLPLVIALVVAAGAVASLFVVRKKLFA